MKMSLLDDFVSGAGIKCSYVIAGGALRDSFFDKPVNDVDVFWLVTQYAFEFIKRSGYMYLGDDFTKFEVDGKDFYDTSKFISVRSPEEPGLNIIFRSDEHGKTLDEMVETLFEEFPCSISKIAYSPVEDKWWISDDFKETLATGFVTMPWDCPEKYQKKIFPKYDDLFGCQFVNIGGVF